MSAKEADELMAEIQRKLAESGAELHKMQQGIEVLRRMAGETFPEARVKLKTAPTGDALDLSD